ncbi:MAG: hypothetical protein AAFU03_05795 [Bacteroidota bacterium]
MLTSDIVNEFEKLLLELVKSAEKEVREQGHVASGRGLRSIDFEIFDRNPNRLVGAIVAEDYMIDDVDPGKTAAEVRREPRARRLVELANWIRIVRPGLSAQERRSFAFLIDRKHRQVGVPTRGSFAFSLNGRRTGWIQEGVVKPAEQLDIERRLRLFELFSRDIEERIVRAAA